MRRLLLGLLPCVAACVSTGSEPRVAFALHGGAGTILRENMTPELEAAYRAKLGEALDAGYAVLAAGGASLDAVEAALLLLEDSELFNAGHGAVLTAEGRCELDASIMNGATGAAGAVAGVRTVRHPILAARAVMERSEHVLLAGEGADAFAREQGLEIVANEFFHTDRRRRQLEELQARAGDGSAAAEPGRRPDSWPEGIAAARIGTVGAVALDRAGRLAAGTSTGGMTNKRWGRVGDSPILGAGTWADARCAVSSTGWGEFFLRAAVAHEIAARVHHAGESLRRAAIGVIVEDLTAAGGTGGVIALDAEGAVAAPFNTPGMYRAWIDGAGQREIRIYGDE